MSDKEKRSRLYYHGSREEVRIGDRVKLKRWFRRDEMGVVCYIPGISPRHSELEYDNIKQWAIKTDDGSVYPILYDPIGFPPPKHIVFLSRGEDSGLKPDDVLAEGTTTEDEYD